MEHALRSVSAVAKRLVAFPFATAIGLIGVNGAITLILNPRSNPVHMLVSPWDYITATIYGLGGLLIVLGIGLNRSDVEAGGCIAFGGGALINAVVWAAIIGWSAWNTVLILLVFSAAALLRAYAIIKGRLLVLVQTKGGEPPRIVGQQ